jgi:glyoxylase-like metal-dependent hydrolase (beta-lactamase superfamily II)
MPDPIPLEDNFTDLIGKAMRGLALADAEVAARAGVGTRAVTELRRGVYDAATLAAVAPVLGLGAAALDALARNVWPPPPAAVPGLACFHTHYGDMGVNAYLVFDSATGEAAAFDTGGDCSPMLDFLAAKNLNLSAIYLTHSHSDHVCDLSRLAARTGAAAWVGEREPLPGAVPFPAGREFRCGALRVGTRLTWGHSRGGITYVIDGLAVPVAVVGDALFAGSMGGGAVSYPDALRSTREQILSLPAHTILCPGHGPLTTVGAELRHNPFFSAET